MGFKMYVKFQKWKSYFFSFNFFNLFKILNAFDKRKMHVMLNKVFVSKKKHDLQKIKIKKTKSLKGTLTNNAIQYN